MNNTILASHIPIRFPGPLPCDRFAVKDSASNGKHFSVMTLGIPLLIP
jgi:hypothetical protein